MAMNYVGKLLSNFKGFYNEINSATLTGAIDVIIVQQEDGSYLSSPWHVRFGKMGVLRSREKIVDIEINDKAVDLHMKLGEAGEAFFVEEIEETSEVPAHLATSPLPDSLGLMEDGLRELRKQSLKCVEAGMSVEDAQNFYSTVSAVVNMDEDSHHVITIDSPESVSSTSSNSKAINMATQTDMTGLQVETIAKSRVPSTSNLEVMGTESEPSLIKVATTSKSPSPRAELDTRQKRRKRRTKKSVDQLKDSSHLEVTSQGSGSSSEFPEEAMFEMDMDEDELDLSRPSISMTTMGRTVSMPIIEGKDKRVDEWASTQYASHFHPFSDGDITPIVSPVGSRPPSPKSDTELETIHNDAVSQTQLTGDELNLIDDITWQWGELPELSSSQDRKDSALQVMSKDDKSKDGPGLFHFMRKTKKIRHQPEQEGIYLDDLNLEQMDPEVAALYLYNKQSSVHGMRTLEDEDTESGRGASLPQSPITVQKEGHEIDPTSHRTLSGMADLTMSLCGGLKDVEATEMSSEKFMQFIVTYDEFCQNPGILSNPNLVIRLADKYYNWQIAGPIIMSALVFQQPLSEAAIEQLVKTHLPKKERRRGWFSWGRSGAEEQTIRGGEKKGEMSSPPSSAPSSTPNSPHKKKEKKPKKIRRIKDGFETDEEESDGSSSKGSGSGSNAPAEVKDDISEVVLKEDSTTQTRQECFKKTLKLSSEEIEKLGLQFGVNEASFSVTTQYQGTSRCNCYIYVWKWDDKLIVSDIDGTITRSDVLGQVLPMIGKDWSQAGIANLYQLIYRNGYRFLYLSARAIGQSKITRDYLKSIRQGDLCLPDGPLLLSPSSLISAFHKEVIERKPEEFKIGCLRNIAALFPQNPLYAGFGNKINDVWAYKAVEIPVTRIFTVNPKGELKAENNPNFMSSYNRLSDITDHFFPALRSTQEGQVPVGNFPAAEQFSTFTYWREPLPDIDMEIDTVMKGETSKK